MLAVEMILLMLFVPGQLVITEVMANPRGGSGVLMPEDRNEFIELYNTGNEAIDLFNYTVDDGDALDRIVAWHDSTILRNNPGLLIGTTWLKPGGFALILDPEYTDSGGLGGYLQPYQIGDSCLILTIGNTTIGNGLTGNDPITVASPYGDTTTFGTPQESEDGFPFDAGDGFSYERIDINAPDHKGNWAVCPDSSGATPGRTNAVSSYFDLTITEMGLIDRFVPEPGERFNFRVGVKNAGFVPAPNWRLLWGWDKGEVLVDIEVASLRPKQESVFVFEATCPQTRAELWCRILCPGDRDTTNNLYRMVVTPGGAGGLLSLGLNSFSPDGDGFEDSLPINFVLPEPGGRMSLKVFDLSGRTVRVIFAGREINEAQGVVYWNGRMDQGGLAPVGLYAVYLEYRYAGRKVCAKQPVVLLKR
ncbi:hypothetical protein HPY86_04185 [candidate division WOR-3 bacterium]|nr:hypothetical protein [candidate division WOR-3 bacterium]